MGTEKIGQVPYFDDSSMFYLLIAVITASRFLPHPPNVACLGAIGLFAGCYLQGRRAYLVPLTALLVSDVVGQLFRVPGLGFYSPIAMMLVYIGALGAVPIGRMMRANRSLFRLPCGALAASTTFFLLSNFGVWLAGWYPATAGGLAACYVSAIPFYGYTIAGDLTFTMLLFGSWELSRGGRFASLSIPLSRRPVFARVPVSQQR